MTSATQFRSNGFQTMAIDGTGRVYLAWTDRGYATVRSDPLTGDARIVLSTSATGTTWTVPKAIQAGGVGHQLMPAMAFHGGKLRILYYDLREDVSQIFGPAVDDGQILDIRHTMDVSVAQAAPGSAPVFTTARVSEYASGFVNGSIVEQQLQFNPPNLPMFRQGSVPFMGDYIDLAPSAPFVRTANGTLGLQYRRDRQHRFARGMDRQPRRARAEGRQLGQLHAGDIRCGGRDQPLRWHDAGAGLRSRPGRDAQPEHLHGAGDRRAVRVGPREQQAVQWFPTRLRRRRRERLGGAALLPADHRGSACWRAGVVPAVRRAADDARRGDAGVLIGRAHGLRHGPQDSTARVRVSVVQVTGVGGQVVPDGLTGEVVLNPDPQNPVLQNPVLQNPVLQNPVLQNIAQGETYNPAISVALVGTPNLQNPVLQNPNLQNPEPAESDASEPASPESEPAEPGVAEPGAAERPRRQPDHRQSDPAEPGAAEPGAAEPESAESEPAESESAERGDQRHQLGGDQRGEYHRLVHDQPGLEYRGAERLHDAAADSQDDAHTGGGRVRPQGTEAHCPDREHSRPGLRDDHRSKLAEPESSEPVLQNPNLQNPTMALAPGDSATVTLRIIDPNIFDGVTYDASAGVTPAAVAQSVNTDDVAAGDTTPSVALPLTITTSEIPPTTPGAPIDRTIGFVAATGTVTCAVVPGLGELPPGVTLSSTGTLSGTPTAPGNYVFTVECVDSGPPERRDRQTLSIQVNPASPVSFDALWNGLDNNWYNPANWSPRGVPSETARVYVSAATTVVPKLTADVTVRDLFLEPGATLDTNGFTLTVTNNADAGRTIIGTGQTVLTGNGSVAAGVFSNLVIAGRITLAAPLTTTGTLTLAPGARLELNGQPLIVGGQLITNVTGGTLPIIVGGAAGNSFIVTGVNVNGLVLNAAPLTINGTLTRFDNVSFSGFAPEAIQLTVNKLGPAHALPDERAVVRVAANVGSVHQRHRHATGGGTPDHRRDRRCAGRRLRFHAGGGRGGGELAGQSW